MVNLASVVRSLGSDPESLFRDAGFSLDEFSDPDHRVPFVRTSHLLSRCVAATDCDHLGLLLGQRAGPSHLGITGFLVRTASTVEQALHAFIGNLDLHDEGGTLSLDIGSDYTTLTYGVHEQAVTAVEQIYDMSAVLISETMRTLCGKDWNAAAVRLVRHAPADQTPYSRYFRTQLYFDSSESAVTFSSRSLEKTPPTADPLLHDHLLQEAWMLHEAQRHDILDVLPAVLRRGLITGRFATPQIADLFGIHERTLHRRLQAAGTSFRQELDQVRRSFSEQLLRATSMPVSDVAGALGYAESSSFIRAFERWYGVSPSAWRRHNSEQRELREDRDE